MTASDSIVDQQIHGGRSDWTDRIIVVVGLIGFALLLGVARWIGGPVIRAETLRQVRGATYAEVRQILGAPARIQVHGTWIYEGWINQGYVAISFDDDGCVASINDEQVDPVTFESGSWSK